MYVLNVLHGRGGGEGEERRGGGGREEGGRGGERERREEGVVHGCKRTVPPFHSSLLTHPHFSL